jgi:hypothetical protein
VVSKVPKIGENRENRGKFKSLKLDNNGIGKAKYLKDLTIAKPGNFTSKYRRNTRNIDRLVSQNFKQSSSLESKLRNKKNSQNHENEDIEHN